MRVEGWIDERNVVAFVELVASSLGYRWDDGDHAAVDHGLRDADLEADRWFAYPIVPEAGAGPDAVIALARDIGSTVLFTRIDIDDPSERLVGRLQALVDVCATCSVTLHGTT